MYGVLALRIASPRVFSSGEMPHPSMTMQQTFCWTCALADIMWREMWEGEGGSNGVEWKERRIRLSLFLKHVGTPKSRLSLPLFFVQLQI